MNSGQGGGVGEDNLTPTGEGGGVGTPDFKSWGWSKDVFGFDIFNSGIFFKVKKIWQFFFWVANLLFVSYLFNAFWKILRLGNSA